MSESDASGRGDSDPAGRVRGQDAVQLVRSHPDWFFRSGRYDSEEVVSQLVEEATRGGARSVRVLREGDWISVSADVDWLGGDVAAFYAPLSYPEGGQNSARVEVVLTAFCDAVVTGVHGAEPHEIKSRAEIPDDSLPLTLFPREAHRTVVFLPPAEARSGDAPDDARMVAPRLGLRLVQGEGEARIVSAVESFVRKAQDA